MNDIESILQALNPDDQAVMRQLRDVILAHLPQGFEEQVSYGMIGYVVPHSIYPKGFHVDPSLPLPFMALARQKHAYTLYHMGLYQDPQISRWFHETYEKTYGRLDCGKSCFRFKTKEKIPFELIGTLVEKISVEDHIRAVEATLTATRR